MLSDLSDLWSYVRKNTLYQGNSLTFLKLEVPYELKPRFHLSVTEPTQMVLPMSHITFYWTVAQDY